MLKSTLPRLTIFYRCNLQLLHHVVEFVVFLVLDEDPLKEVFAKEMPMALFYPLLEEV